MTTQGEVNAQVNNPLVRNQIILDSGATIHVFNDLDRFTNFRKASRGHQILTGNGPVGILGYGDITLRLQPTVLRLKKVAFCPNVPTNIVSFDLIRQQGIYWDTVTNTLFRFIDHKRRPVCKLTRDGGHQLFQETDQSAHRSPRDKSRPVTTAFSARRSTKPRAPLRGSADLWHHRMGHIGPVSLLKLGKTSFGTRLIGPATTQCPACAQAKIHRKISRRTPTHKATKPGEEIHIDWTDLEEAYEGFVRVMFITDAFSGMVFNYFMRTHGTETENLAILKDFTSWVSHQFNYKVLRIRSDHEQGRHKTRNWMRLQHIDFEPSTPRTPAQNGRAERSGGVITEKARAMRIHANLPHDLWNEAIQAAVYLYNRTPRQAQDWKTPYEIFLGQKPQLAHLRAYGCRAYAMTEDAQLKENRLFKLNPRAYIGYLVGYESTNIFRVWVPEKGTIITTRDVIFDETRFFSDKDSQPPIVIDQLDDLIAKIQIPKHQLQNERLLEPTDEETQDEGDDEPDDSDPEAEENEEIIKALEQSLLTPPATNEDTEDEDEDAHFDAFSAELVTSADQNLGMASSAWQLGKQRIHKRSLPPIPKSSRDLKGHPFETDFREAQRLHLLSHQHMRSFQEVPRQQARGSQVLSCMWVFVYKTDKHGFLQKCKARLVVCGNQQAYNNLPTRADTLASATFRALMGIVAKFDLETIQLDAVNAFVNCPLDEVVYMRLPPGYEKPGLVLRLKKALYGLRRSPLLWQKMLTKAFSSLGFRTLAQEPCVMVRGGLIAFFYVDDINLCFPGRDKVAAKEVVARLSEQFAMTNMGELQWFLGIHVIRDRAKRTIWLSQEAYIEKMANEYGLANTGQKLPDTPMSQEELLPASSQATEASRHLYQRKTGSLSFASITTRPDIAFSHSRLAQFNQNPDETHHKAADRVILYLLRTKGLAPKYGGLANDSTNGTIRSMICSSDAAFADNSLDRKSSQGYLIQLFGGPIAWKANKQATVTTSSTEAELLALSQTAKEAIFMRRLLASMKLQLDEKLVVLCDNTQTIRLITEESMKLSTRLRHVDIHNHWLRQEYQAGRVGIEWIESARMPADGLTKALPKQRHDTFIKQLNLDDVSDRLAMEKRMEALKDSLTAARRRPTAKEEAEASQTDICMAIVASPKTKVRREWKQSSMSWTQGLSVDS